MESVQRLTAVPYDCFLLRESESLPGRLTLSVKQKGELSHVLIECTEVGVVTKGEVEPFQNMASFISHISSYLPPCPKPGKTSSNSGETGFFAVQILVISDFSFLDPVQESNVYAQP